MNHCSLFEVLFEQSQITNSNKTMLSKRLLTCTTVWTRFYVNHCLHFQVLLEHWQVTNSNKIMSSKNCYDVSGFEKSLTRITVHILKYYLNNNKLQMHIKNGIEIFAIMHEILNKIFHKLLFTFLSIIWTLGTYKF